MTDETMKDIERDAFEKWATENNHDIERYVGYNGGGYILPATHWLWVAWQARAAALQAALTDEQIESLWYCHMGHSISSGRMVAKAISFARALLTQAGLDKLKEM